MESFHNRRRSYPKIDKNIAGLYDFERTLGSGHFAVVKLARHVFTGEKVAVKVIDKTKLDEVSRAHLYQEVRCMKLVQHPNVVRLYEVVDTPTKLYLILEFGDGGDMYDHIMKHEGINEEKAKHYFRQIVSAIDYCHKLHVVHRDLKPENVIFFKSQDVAKLTDFGFSNNFAPGEKLSTSCGSLAYSAPEILLGDSYEAPAVDVWSLGVILYMMVCGEGPFSHTNDSETLTKIMDCSYYFPDHLSEECRSLIGRMLVREPSKRASLDSIYHDPWLKTAIEEEEASPEPLISELRVTPDLHLNVLQKMESGDIAKREDIKKSLEDNKYDHIAATYFLIAEKLLKRSYGSTAFHLKLEDRRSFPYEETRSLSDPNLLDVDGDTDRSGTSSPITRQRSHNSSSPSLSQRKNSLPRSFDDMSDISPPDAGLNEGNIIYATELAPRSLNIAPRTHRLTYPTSLMKTTSSTPNLLNEIYEENESDFEDSPRNSPKNIRRNQRRQRKYDKKRPGCRLSPIHSRRSSCSSSDDEDLQKLDRRLNIQVAISAARMLPNVPENGGSKESGSNENGSYKAKSLDLLEKFLLEGEKENNPNIMNLFDSQNKLFVTSVNGRVRNLSDTNLVSYHARYQLPLLKDMKCSSDTNLSTSFHRKRALIQRQDALKLNLKQNQFGICNSPVLSSSSPIKEESPSDISPMSSPVTESKHSIAPDASDVEMLVDKNGNSPSIIQPKMGTTRKNGRQIDPDEFSSIQDSEESSSILHVSSSSRKDGTQSRSGSRNSLKYLYNELTSNDGNNCYTIEETNSQENLKATGASEATTKSRTNMKDGLHGYSVGKVGRMVVGEPVNSQCCAIL